MVDGPLVSVIVPVYKVEQFLDECVEGIVAQTYRNLEILLVDDGSPDNCPAMCDAWAAKDDRIRVIHKTNGGLSDARNAALSESHGDYIYFVDSDDAIETNLVERCLATAREYDADVVMFKFDTISETGRPLKSSYRHNEFDDVQVLTPQDAIKEQVKSEIGGYFWAFMAAGRIYRDQDFSFPVGRKIEDMARICNVLGEATRVVRIPETLYHYRMRRGSITASLSPELYRDWMKAADDRAEYVERNHPELKRFMALQQLTFFANLDYETIRQSVVAGLKIDPEDADAMRSRIDRLAQDVKDNGDEVPEDMNELLPLLREFFGGFKTDVKDNFREIRDDWRRLCELVHEGVRVISEGDYGSRWAKHRPKSGGAAAEAPAD
ncbi:glycosyltransferase [Bifidobacterium sp. 82T24]|uniref:glycosyltransferase family 2 protein n=1 Tax=Bifidobacterium pluvialisilvae TaxID=2834436 RepID=UPI001C59BB05|nr:glycosyltransferase [Bifidobacterium pluvialisilvae]MBW3088650.1 glycosyltransferase [Bifidobacterium pluvialisilvae]